jgi:hypothetical protein
MVTYLPREPRPIDSVVEQTLNLQTGIVLFRCPKRPLALFASMYRVMLTMHVLQMSYLSSE